MKTQRPLLRRPILPPRSKRLAGMMAGALLGTLNLMAQDKLWVNGSQLIDFNAPSSGAALVCDLPIGPTNIDYQGAPAQYSQNAQYDENGKLLFFVVDGAVYDHAGYLMADNLMATNCNDCLLTGIQSVSIVLVPGTCDKYYIIAADSKSISGINKSQIAYSILDLTGKSRYHLGRRGRIMRIDDDESYLDEFVAGMGLIPGSSEAGVFLDQLLAQSTASYYDSGLSATFVIGSGNVGVGAPNSSRRNNIYHVVHEGSTPTAPKVLLVRTAMEYLQTPITAHGIPTMVHLYAGGQGSYADEPLVMTGGLDVAQGPDGVVRLATAYNVSMNVPIGPGIFTLLIGDIQFTADVPTLLTNVGINTYGGAIPTPNTGRVRGLAFSPNGRYLYFSQAFAPYVGYIDVQDPLYTIHDLESELGLAVGSLAPFGLGQVRLGTMPDASGNAIYFPSAMGMGYLENPDNPTLAIWHSTLSTTSPLATPPVSAVALQGSWPVTQYLMDMQNYRDQQIPSLQNAMCCQANERIPEATHMSSFSGITTQAAPWTPLNNPLSVTQACASAGAGANGYVFFEESFTVQTGARLYVKNMEWRFGPNARLIVEKGAYINFDNCVLRGSICGPMKWPGVELRGTPYLAQGASAYPADQARMVFNNSTLQDAVVGVTAGKKNLFGMVEHAGGILETTGSIFRNCHVGVNFYPYQNKLPNGSPARNRSKFVRTTFTADANYIAPLDFSTHVQFWKVDGIEFLGCIFENLRITETNSSQLGQGIRSLDAHFKVLPLCSMPGNWPPPCLPAYVVPSRFTGLDMGIRAAKAVTSRNFEVNQAEFANNVCGVYANSVLNFEVHKSNFEVGSSKAIVLDNTDEQYWDVNGSKAHRGIYSYMSSGFLVDDNTLTNNPGATTPQLEGIVTGYSGANNDVVFRNHASNLDEAYIGEGICVDLSNRAITGLWYLCNTNANNNNGIVSGKDISPGHGADADQTIRTNQGTRQRVADNSFGQTSGQLDIKNENYANNALSYWWTFPQVPYWPQYTSAGVSSDNHDAYGNYLVRDPDNCASRILPIHPVPPHPGPVELRAYWLNEAQERKAAYGNTRYLYDQLIDGGSTDETVQEIQSTWPDEAWELRAMLLEKSPFLSTDVLKQMVLKNIMPPAMVAEICIANPDATKKEGFLKWLQYEAPVNMPQYLIDNIEASWETKTYRTTLESTMAFQHSEMTQALDLTLASYHADTLTEQVDSIRATWQVLRTTAARYAEILTYLQQDNFDSAYAVMDRLPVEFKLKEKEISEKDRTKQFISIVQNYRNDGRSEAELTEDDLTALRDLRDGGYDRPGEWAQNLLCFGYGDCRPPRTGGSGEQVPKAMRVPTDQATDEAPALSAYPNPAGAWANLVYSLKAAADHAYLSIRDVAGKEIARMPVERNEGQAVWNTRAIVPGAYTVELVNGGSSLGTVKLIVKP